MKVGHLEWRKGERYIKRRRLRRNEKCNFSDGPNKGQFLTKVLRGRGKPTVVCNEKETMFVCEEEGNKCERNVADGIGVIEMHEDGAANVNNSEKNKHTLKKANIRRP
jgi:hypothetical protein